LKRERNEKMGRYIHEQHKRFEGEEKGIEEVRRLEGSLSLPSAWQLGA
jgi:hypothetical protein